VTVLPPHVQAEVVYYIEISTPGEPRIIRSPTFESLSETPHRLAEGVDGGRRMDGSSAVS
jgi:hypothetical protein